MKYARLKRIRLKEIAPDHYTYAGYHIRRVSNVMGDPEWELECTTIQHHTSLRKAIQAVDCIRKELWVAVHAIEYSREFSRKFLDK